MGSAGGATAGGMTKPQQGQLGQVANPQAGDVMQNRNRGGLPMPPKPPGGGNAGSLANTGGAYNPLGDSSLTRPGANQPIPAGPRQIQNLPPGARQIQPTGPISGNPLAAFQRPQQLPGPGNPMAKGPGRLSEMVGKLPGDRMNQVTDRLQGNPMQGILSGMAGRLGAQGPIGGPETFGQNMRTTVMPTRDMPAQPKPGGPQGPGAGAPGGGGITPSQAGGK